MILITVALVCEAKCIISALNLKRINDETRWELFGNEEEVLLLITGTGPVAAAASVSSVMTRYGFAETGFVINIGTCCDLASSQGKLGQLFLINRITDGETGRDYYPDMMIDSELPEKAVISVAMPVYSCESGLQGECEENGKQRQSSLYDMEAAFIYQTVKYYLGPSKVAFLKLVSDNGLQEGTASFSEMSKKIEEYMSNRQDEIISFITSVKKYMHGRRSTEKTGQNEKSNNNENLPEALHATRTMENKLMQLIKYSACAGIDFQTIIDRMYSEGLLPVKNKKDGISVLNRIEEEMMKE